MLLWLTPEVLVDRLVPELLNTFPVLDLPALEQVADLMRLLLALNHGLLANIIIHFVVLKFSVFLATA
jgi:hypothetical protein